MEQRIFTGCNFYILPARLGTTRLSVLKGNIKKMGGSALSSIENSGSVLTHVVVEDSFVNNSEKCYELLKNSGVDYSRLEVVTTKWLSSCLKEQKLLDTKPYLLQHEGANSEEKRNIEKSSLYQKYSNTKSPVKTDVEQEEGNRAVNGLTTPKKRKLNIEKFATLQVPYEEKSCNRNIIAQLQKLADTFRNIGDQWRAHGYDKAIASIKSHGKNIQSYEEAVTLPGIGKKMAEKIMEIVETGTLQKVEEVCNSEKSRIITLFTKIWGVGPATAQSWYVQGFRTLDDLCSKANLTKQQTIGLKYFTELQERIPREEVQQIGKIVEENALAINPDVTAVVCGSYRRGKSTCGDVDVLLLIDVAFGDLLLQLLKQLRGCGLITDDLMNVEDIGSHKKYLGICQLPQGKHRRLDIFVAPKCEMATALMHYTGSALFNRAIRLHAAEKGMYLSEHYLMSGVVREGSKLLKEGLILETPTEESIFQHLGLPYRLPTERDQ